jgi:PRTRC genetic system protein B
MIDLPQDPSFAIQGALFFLDGGHYLFRTNDNVRSVSKFVTSRDVAAAFAGQEQDTGWMPAGVLRAGHNAIGDWFVYSAPAQKVEITLEAKEGRGAPDVLKVPIPRTVLLGSATHYYLWALKTDHFEREAPVFHAPFPNVYSDGRVCWGANTAPSPIPQNARKAWELFFGTPFNIHLAADKSRSHPRDVGQLLRELAEKKSRSYPIGDLVKFDWGWRGHPAIGDPIDQLIQGER